MHWLLPITCAIVAVAASSFFSGAETGVYRISRFRLRLGIRQRRASYMILGRCLEDAHGLVLALLSGNNLANYAATSIVTFLLLAHVSDHHVAEFYATVILAPVLFVFGDIVPKTISYYRADALLPRFAFLIWLTQTVFTWLGVVPLLKLITRSVHRILGVQTDVPAALEATGRHHIRQIIQETRDEGLLTPVQREIMHRLVGAQDTTVEQVMTPLGEVAMAPFATKRDQLPALLAQSPHTRLPVYRNRRSDVVGYVDIRELLAAATDFADLSAFVRPLERLEVSMSVLEAINRIRRSTHKVAAIVVADEGPRQKEPRTIGIATLKDLVEEITGCSVP